MMKISKISVVLFLLLFSFNAWSSRFSANRGKGKGERPGGVPSEVIRNLNSRASQILGVRVELIIDRNTSPQRLRSLESSYEKLLNTLHIESRKEAFSSSKKRQEIAQILNSMNMGFATRSNLVDFIAKNRESADPNSQQAVASARDLVDIIDNSFNILQAKIKDGYRNQSFVDGTKINDVLGVFGQVNGRFDSQMVMRLVREIESRFDYSEGLFSRSEILKKIARCR